MVAGLLLMGAAACLTLYNLWSEYRAGNIAQRLVLELPANMGNPTLQPEYIGNPDMEMPEKLIDGERCIGILEIPALDLVLPVIDEWGERSLQAAPCRYCGSVYRNDLVLCAHNYGTHFGKIKYLSFGDAVIFTDMSSNVFQYRVKDIEILPPTAVEEMIDSRNWDMTLFTCTIGGSARVTVRCGRIL